jgi:hypothetical protein
VSGRGGSMTETGQCKFSHFAVRSINPNRIMPSTRAATISSPSGPPGRARGARPLLIGTLACCTWFVVGSQLWAMDLDGIPGIQSRDAAADELERACENVEKTRAEAAAARERLDVFLSRHFDQRHRLDPPEPAKPRKPDAGAAERPNPKLAELKTELEELRAHRRQLLGYLTEEHPQVFDVDERIADVEQQIAILARVATPPDGNTLRATADAEKRWVDYLSGLARQREQDAAEYRLLYDAWKLAEFAMDDALEAETAAARRIESSASSRARAAEAAAAGQAPDGAPSDLAVDRARGFGDAEPSTGAAEGEEAVIAAGGTGYDSDSSGLQPLALAALLIALAVAALAAVWLARSTADPLFASVDEVAAALAIPVVGIIPATAGRLQPANLKASRQRRWILLGQILLAVLVFVVIACAVQNPGDLWRLCAHPLRALGSLVRGIGGGN